MRGIEIDWYTDFPATQKTTWVDLKKVFQAKFKLLRDDDEAVAKIYNTHQGKNESVRVYQKKLKELIGKLENKSADELMKRWFIEGHDKQVQSTG